MPTSSQESAQQAGATDEAARASHRLHDAAKDPGQDITNVTIAKGDTAAQAAAKLQAGVSDPSCVASVKGAVVTITPSAGSTVQVLTVTIK